MQVLKGFTVNDRPVTVGITAERMLFSPKADLWKFQSENKKSPLEEPETIEANISRLKRKTPKQPSLLVLELI